MNITEELRLIKQRKNCPVLGFRCLAGILLQDDESLNSCGLQEDGCVCDMTIANFKSCRHAIENNEKSLNNTVYPDELVPRNGENWEGISMEEWINLFYELRA